MKIARLFLITALLFALTGCVLTFFTKIALHLLVHDTYFEISTGHVYLALSLVLWAFPGLLYYLAFRYRPALSLRLPFAHYITFWLLFLLGSSLFVIRKNNYTDEFLGVVSLCKIIGGTGYLLMIVFLIEAVAKRKR